jgi:hypothetical protein
MVVSAMAKAVLVAPEGTAVTVVLARETLSQACLPLETDRTVETAAMAAAVVVAARVPAESGLQAAVVAAVAVAAPEAEVVSEVVVAEPVSASWWPVLIRPSSKTT